MANKIPPYVQNVQYSNCKLCTSTWPKYVKTLWLSSVLSIRLYFWQTGIVRRSRDTFFIHALPARLARHVKGKEEAIPHLVYRRSPQKEIDYETKLGTYLDAYIKTYAA